MSTQIATPLWQFRSLQNWARDVLIKELCPTPGAKVAQIGGAGFDLGKWERAQVAFLLNVDTEEEQSEQAETRWIAKGSPFLAHFLTANLTSDLRSHPDLSSEIGNFSLVISTDTTLERTLCRNSSDMMATLTNISAMLEQGGHFAGFVWDSAEIWQRSVQVSEGAQGMGTNVKNKMGGFSSSSSSSSPASGPSVSSIKDSFFAAGTYINVQIPRMAQMLGLEAKQMRPSENQLFLDWLPSSPTLGLDISVNMEQRSENFFITHVETLVEAAKLVGLSCLSFRNLLDFYDSFKLREDEQLRKLQVYTKSVPKLLPEQKDAANLFALFVFVKL